MRSIRALLSDISRNPIARVVFACLLLAASAGGLAGVRFVDNYFNGGVTYGSNTPPVPLADVNPMGVNLFLEKEVEQQKVVQTLDMARDAGFKWIRQGFSWNDIEISAKGNYTDTRNPGIEVNAWAKYDFIVDQAVAHGMTIMARLDSPPQWARIPGDNLEQYHKGPPANPNDYGDFAEAVATRYKGKINYFQIWNEPNLIGEWGGHAISAYEYVALLKVAHDRIKAVEPDAVIISAALAPTTDNSVINRSDILFLQDMYTAGGAPYFDVVATMLYDLGPSPTDRRMDFNRLSFSRPALLRDVMVRNGDAETPIWISEYGWISYPDNLQQTLGLNDADWAAFDARNIWRDSVDEQTQARYLVEGYQRARSEWPWMGVMFVWNLRNPDANPLEPASYFTILNPDFTPRPAYTALQEYSKVVPEKPTPQDMPLFSAAALLLSYGLFFALSLASLAYGATGIVGWGMAALNYPRERYNPAVRELARNGAAVVGLVALFAIYYTSSNIGLIAMALLGFLVIAVLKPQPVLALVAFGIPFMWYPKQLGGQQFSITETLIFLAFAAFVARRVIAFAQPGVAAQLHITKLEPSTTIPDEYSLPTILQDVQPASAGARTTRSRITQPIPIRHEPKTTRPLPIMREPVSLNLEFADDDLEAAQWPTRPKELIAELQKPIVVDWSVDRGQKSEFRNQKIGTGTPETATSTPTIGYRLPATRNRQLTTDNRQPRLAQWLNNDAFALPALIMLALGVLSMFTLVNQEFAADSARALRWVIIEPVMLYFLLTDLIKSRQGLLRVFDFFVAAGVIVSLIGLWQFVSSSNTLDVEGVSRVLGVYKHPNNLALYLDRIAPFAACAALFLPWGWRKSLYAVACLPVLATFLLTFSRGAWVALALAVVLAVSIGIRWPLGWISGRASSLFKWWALAVLVAGIIGVTLIALVFPSLPDRIFNPSSGLKRLDIWESALRMGSEHPIFGIGLDQFLNQYQLKDATGNWVYIKPEQSAELFTAHPHNIVLDWWLSLGIIGLFVMTWLLWQYFGEAIALAKATAQKLAPDPILRAILIGLIASMTAFLIHGLVDNSYFLMDLALIFWLSCGALQLSRMLYKESEQEETNI